MGEPRLLFCASGCCSVDELSRKVRQTLKKGWALISLRSYEEALNIFDYALQLDPSSREPVTGKDYIFRDIFQKPVVREHSDASRKQAGHKETLAKSCQSAEDYYERGYILLTLDRDDEASRAFMRCLELDPLDLDIYEDVSRLYFVRHKYEKSLAIYNQALQIFPACAKLHEKRAEVLLRLERS